MTRVNLIDPRNLTNQHLMAEYREIYHIPKALERSLRARSKIALDLMIPSKYTLNKGHVMFFYNKGLFLERRSADLYEELVRRDYNITKKIYPTDVFKAAGYYLDWEPDDLEVAVNVERLCERLAMRPSWYRYYGLLVA